MKLTTIVSLLLLFSIIREGNSQSYSFNDTIITTRLDFSNLEIRGDVQFGASSVFAPREGAVIKFFNNGKLTIQGAILDGLLSRIEITSGAQDCSFCEMTINALDTSASIRIQNSTLHNINRSIFDSIEYNLGFLKINNFKDVKIQDCLVDKIEIHDRRISVLEKYGALRFDSCRSVRISQSSFSGNWSSLQGGGCSFFSCDSIFIENCDFIKNTAFDTIRLESGIISVGGQGSSIFTQGARFIDINSCLLVNGLSTSGDIYIQSPSALVHNSIFSNNDAGSIVFVGAGENRLISNCTILNNRRRPLLTVGDAEIRNCFVLNNRISRPPMSLSPDEDVFVFSNGEVTYTNSVFFDGCRGCSSTDAVDTAGILSAPIRIDANYVDAVNLSDFYPGPTSWLIDKGDSTGISLTDLDFFGAPRWYGEAPDIGAVEWQGVSSTSSDPLNKFTFSFFPNPTRGNLQISCSEELKEFHIYDITGRVIVSENISSGGNLHSLDLEQLRVGTYFIEVVTNKDERSSSKFLRLD